jgi:hypothetical protein
MIRNVILFLALVCLSFPAFAESKPLEFDPDGKGFMVSASGEISKLNWAPISTNCTPCEALVSSYNDMMTSLFDLRYQKKVMEVDLEQAKKNEQNVRKLINSSGNKGMNYDEQTLLTTVMSYQEKAEALKGRIQGLETQITQLEDVTKNMRSEIARCEKQCTNSEYKKLIEPDNTVSPGLPFAWRGPYPEVCEKCAKLSARLNELPGLAYGAMGKIEKAKADKTISEAEIANARADFDIAATSAGNNMHNQNLMDTLGLKGKDVYEKTIRENEKRIEAADRIIEANEKDLEEIKKNFAQTLDLYNKCTPTCPKQTGAADPPKDDDTAFALGGDYSKDLKGCTLGYLPGESYVIGANSEYGTGAVMKDKAKDMASGAAMGALNSVLGGSGISLGGRPKEGGGMQQIDDPGQEGPKLDKNPLAKDEWLHLPSSEEWDIGIRVGFNDNGLLVNQKIFDSPGGNSTFHATWLEDAKGRKLLPSGYYIYSIYVDHKLTVWWTYDRWVDGEHVEHDEGRETTEWRTNLGDFKVRFGGHEGLQNSLWYNSGYDTAVKGVQEMGAFYNIKPADLSDCPVGVVTHYTMPGLDPVRTYSNAFGLHWQPEGGGANKGRTLNVNDALGLDGLTISTPLNITGKVDYEFKWDDKPAGVVKPTHLNNFPPF